MRLGSINFKQTTQTYNLAVRKIIKVNSVEKNQGRGSISTGDQAPDHRACIFKLNLLLMKNFRMKKVNTRELNKLAFYPGVVTTEANCTVQLKITDLYSIWHCILHEKDIETATACSEYCLFITKCKCNCHMVKQCPIKQN